MTMAEIVYGLNKHLKRMDADPNINKAINGTSIGGPGVTHFYLPYAVASGNRIMVRYVAYQISSSLTKAQAQAYLDWLNAGNNGRHYEALREAK